MISWQQWVAPKREHADPNHAFFYILTLFSPSSSSVAKALVSMHEDGISDCDCVIRLLECLSQDCLVEPFLSKLLIPTDSGCLHPQADTYFNDLGSNAYLVSLPENCRRTHENVSLGLARSLCLKNLSTLQTQEEEEDMAEHLSTRIQNVLRQYKRDQLPTEFLANAADAGATHMDFIVDEFDFSHCDKQRLITPELIECQSGGALVIYNNSVFSAEDWKGIRHVGEGSKRGKTGKIGRFGLGSLASYHMSEVSVTLSVF